MSSEGPRMTRWPRFRVLPPSAEQLAREVRAEIRADNLRTLVPLTIADRRPPRATAATQEKAARAEGEG